MADRPKFRRKRRKQPEEISDVLPRRVPEGEEAPIAPLDSREERLVSRAETARHAAETEAAAKAEKQQLARDAARRGAEARAEAKRRAEAEAQAQEARQREAAGRLRARKQAEAEAEEKARDQAAEQARTEDQRKSRDAARKAEETAQQREKARIDRQRAKARDAADAREQARLKAQDQARKIADAEAHAKAIAEARARAEAEERAATNKAKARAAEAEAKERARRAKERRKSGPSPEAVAKGAPLALNEPIAPEPAQSPTDYWARMEEFTLAPRILERNRIITAERTDPAHATFDVLRTRLLQALTERGWTRVAITSPTKDCGKTFTAANLAISLARQENCGTLLLDLDMRAPSLHKVFGLNSQGSIGEMLRGKVAPTTHLMRPGTNDVHVGRKVAFGFNSQIEDYAAELLQDPETARSLQTMQAQLKPDVVLYDMPPALSSDDVIASRAHFDAVLLVIGGGLTTEAEIKEVERRLGDQTPLLGMVLNMAEGVSAKTYAY